MGILTSAINEVISGAVGIGTSQFDKWLTRRAEEVGLEKAAVEADKLIAEGQNYNAQQAMGGVLPVMNGQPYDMGMQNQIQPIPQLGPHSQAFSNNFTGQLATQAIGQNIKNDPNLLAMELQKKMAETGISAAGTAAGTLGGQGILGNQDINPYVTGSRAFSASQIQKGKGDVAGIIQSAKDTAGIPKERRLFQQQVQLKQTPGARAMGGGEETKAGMPTTAINQVQKLLAQKGDKYGTVEPGIFGGVTYTPNADGEWILNRANEIFKSQGKNKNFLGAFNQSLKELEQNKKQQQKEAEDYFLNQSRQPIIPPTQGQTQQLPQYPTARSVIEQKINKARTLGIPDPEIKKALIEDGLNPAEYGFR